MIVSCSTYGYRFLSLESTLKRISALGFKAVDLMATRPHLLPTDYKDLTDIANLLTSLNLKVSAITAFDGHPQWHLTAANKKHRADTVEHVKRCIEVAENPGARVVQAITGMPVIQDIPFTTAWGYAKENLFVCADYAKKHNVYIALEGEENNVVRTSHDIYRMLEEVGHPNLKTLLEVGHANMMASDDPICAIETLKDEIIHCHVHDNMGTADDHAVPGDGTVYWAGAIKKLVEIEYKGYLALELLVSNPDRVSIRGKEFLEGFIH